MPARYRLPNLVPRSSSTDAGSITESKPKLLHLHLQIHIRIHLQRGLGRGRGLCHAVDCVSRVQSFYGKPAKSRDQQTKVR